MKRLNCSAGIAAAALLFVTVLAGCAYESRIIKEVPAEELAKIYLVDRNTDVRDYFDWLDGNKTGFLKAGLIAHKDKSQQTTKPLLEVIGGEHTIGVSTPRDFFPGRKDYKITYNFEAGKRYKIQIGVDPSLNFMEGGKAALAGNWVVNITDMDAPPSERKTIELNIDLTGTQAMV